MKGSVRHQLESHRPGRGCLALVSLAVLLQANLARGLDLPASSAAELILAVSRAQPGDTVILEDGFWPDVDILFTGSGTAAKPITLRARTAGQVLLSGASRLRLAGEFLVVEGLKFVNGYLVSGDVIAFRDTASSVANNCRVSNCAIIDYNPDDPEADTKWVSFYGLSNRLDHCYLKGKNNLGSTVVVWVDSQPNRPNYHRIDHNYFGPRPPLEVNGGETIRIGTSEVSMNLSRTVVENNFFEQCDGDVEIVSNKSGENVYRHNTFVECVGALTLRHGNGCIVQGNYFFGHGKPQTGGVRIIGEDHRVYNNYFADLTGSSWGAALSLSQGLTNSPLNGYFQVKRAEVVFNTFVNCQHNFLLGLADTLAGTTNVTTLPPVDCRIANNVVLGANFKMVDQRIQPVNLTWEGNILFGPVLGIPAENGLSRVDPKLVLAADGLWRPAPASPALGSAQGTYGFVSDDMEGQARPSAKDVGCDQASSGPVTQPPLTSIDVGPIWMQTRETILVWANPAEITYGRALGPAQLNAEANIPGTFVYTPPAGLILNAGLGQTLSVVFTPNDTAHYSAVTQTVTIDVVKATPIIVWPTPAGITYGTALDATQLNAIADLPGSFAYAPPEGSVLHAGNGQALTATFTPEDGNNYATVLKTVPIDVAQATPVIRWSDPAAITNGTPLGDAQLNATADVPGTFVYTPAAGAVLAPGSEQLLSAVFLPADPIDYAAATRSVRIDVTSGGKLIPIITWPTPAAVTFGTPLSAAQLNARANVPGTFVYQPPAGTVLSAANAQVLTATFTPSDSTNYAAASKTVTLQIDSALIQSIVRVAYVIPADRSAQPEGVASLRQALLLYQSWFRLQMQDNGFGPKTFTFETEADGATPAIHVVRVAEPVSALGGGPGGGGIRDAARAAGVPIGTPGEVWWLIPETHVQQTNGSVNGGLHFGFRDDGSGESSGWAMFGSDLLSCLRPGYLTNNTPYDNLLLPELGPYPLHAGISFPWFDGATLSSVSSSALGAGLRGLAEAFGLDHDFRNDENFDGNLMGFGFRGIRGAFYPRLYRYNQTRLSYGGALVLNVNPFFNFGQPVTDYTRPQVTATTAGAIAPVDGLLRITFSASDASGLAAALLLWNKDSDQLLVGELSLAGTNSSGSFTTAYFEAGQTNNYIISVFDSQGNRQNVATAILPSSIANHAPLPSVAVSPASPGPGEDVVLDASGTFDSEHRASLLEVEWDLDGDGIFDTEPTTNLLFTNRYPTLGTRLIRARVTDPAGSSAVSAPVTLNISPCAAVLSPSARVHGSGATTGTVSVATGPTCQWTVVNTNQWITVSSGSSYTGGAKISYALAANPSPAERTGTLQLGDQLFAITQKGITCTYTLSPSSRFHGFGTVAGSVKVTTKGECPWIVQNTNSWITVTSDTTNAGSANVTYTLAANRNLGHRTGLLTIADQLYSVTQWGTNCTYVISPSSRFHHRQSETGLVSVAANSGCPWGVVNTNDWITITSNTEGTGSTSLSYTVGANPGLTERAGALLIGDLPFQVRQSACEFVLWQTNALHGSAEESGELTLLADGPCSWSVLNTNPWITVLSPPNGTGNAAIRYGVNANPHSQERRGVIIVADQLFTVIQSGVPCAFQLSSRGWGPNESGGTGEIAVRAGADCAWTVSNTNNWITILSSASDAGAGNVTYSVDLNEGPARTGTFFVADLAFVVNQSRGVHLARAGDMAVGSGEVFCLPISLEMHAGEAALHLSLCYDPSLLTFISAEPGEGVPGLTLDAYTFQVGQGRVGLMWAAPSGWTGGSGMQPIMMVCFRAATVPGRVTSTVGFCDEPIARELTDLAGRQSTVLYSNASVRMVGECTLGASVGAAQYAWTTDSSAPWTCETNVTHDGFDAAQSAPIADGDSSAMELTVPGPGTLSFWWKISSETNNDRVKFYLNDSEQARISGEVDWEWRSFDLSSGSQVLRWKYSKKGGVDAGLDRAWVDEVLFTPGNAAGPPSIVSQPTSQVVLAQGTAVFRVSAVGSSPLSYQWQWNGTKLADGGGISGATTAQLTIANAQPVEAGEYAVLVRNAAGAVTSASAQLRLTTDAGLDFLPIDGPMAPIVTSQPVSQEVAPGSNFTCRVVARGSAPLGYQWQFNGVDLTDGDVVSGATSPALTLWNVQERQEGTYRVIVRNDYSWAISSNAVLRVVPVVAPADALDTPGQIWITGGSSPWIGQRAINHDGLDAAQSGLLLDGQTNWLQTIVPGPAAVTFWWKVSSESSHDRLQFFVDGQEQANVSGEVDWVWRTFDLTNLNQVLRWAYTKDKKGSAGLDRGWLDQVQFWPLAPLITRQPVSQGADSGAMVTFSVGDSSASPVNYQWRCNGLNVLDGTNVGGATLGRLVLSNAQPAQAGIYSVMVRNGGGRVLSTNAWLTVYPGQPLAQALNNRTNVWNTGWTTGGDAPWVTQTSVAQDGVRAGQSGAIGDNQRSWVETTVLGPGKVSFWWKVSSEINTTIPGGSDDNLRFYISGAEQLRISGNVNWQSNVFNVSNGIQVLHWRYQKNSTLAAGQDRGWLDQVQFDPTLPPVLTTQPASLNTDPGGTAIFNVAADGTLPLGYQWQFNGTSLIDGNGVSGATTSSLKLSNVQPSQAGAYTVAVSNAAAIVTSSNAFLSVTPTVPLAEALDTPGWIWTTGGSAPPWLGQVAVHHDGLDAARNGIIGDGASNSIQTTVTGPALLSFWWKVSSETNNDTLRFFIGNSEQDHISGEVDWQRRTFSVPSGSQTLKWTYSKNGSLAAGQDRGWVDQIQFTVAPPTITSQPANQAVDAGATVNFNVTATGTPPLGYQWQLNGVNLLDGGAVQGATTATLTLNNVQPGQSGNYSVVVTNWGGSVTSSRAQLSVTPLFSLAEALDTPGSVWVTSGSAPWVGQGAVTHDGVDAGRSGAVGDGNSGSMQTTVPGPGTVSFWWKVSSETNSDTLRFYVGGSEQARLSGEVDWQMRSFNVPSGSQTLKWTYSKNSSRAGGLDRAWVDQVLFIGTPPAITAQPSSQTVDAGTTVNLTVAASGTAPLGYQWRLNGVNLSDGSGVSGAGSATLTLANAQPSQSGAYSVVVGNAAGNVTSANAQLTVRLASPGLVITSQPISRSVNPGATVSFVVGVSGPGPLSYQWLFNERKLTDGGNVSGATAFTLTLSNVQPAQAGFYSVEIRIPTDSAISTAALLTVQTTQSLADALDAPMLVWETYGDALWIPQTAVTHDGIDAAQSGSFLNGASTLHTYVTGPGSVSFWWKLSSEANIDSFRFYVGGVLVAEITGVVDWQPQTFAVPAGSQELKWKFKDAGSTGQDRGWVDEVAFISGAAALPQLLPSPIVAKITLARGRVLLTWETHPGKSYEVLYKDDLSEPAWQVLVGDVLMTDSGASLETVVEEQPQRFYQIVEY